MTTKKTSTKRKEKNNQAEKCLLPDREISVCFGAMKSVEAQRPTLLSFLFFAVTATQGKINDTQYIHKLVNNNEHCKD